VRAHHHLPAFSGGRHGQRLGAQLYALAADAGQDYFTLQ
jgi:hypothetical protein